MAEAFPADICYKSEDEDSDGWEEMDLGGEQTTCLFCPLQFHTIAVALDHCRTAHSFDLLALKKKYNMDCYSYIKMINYIRRHKPDPKMLSDAPVAPWDDDCYLKPGEMESWLVYEDFSPLLSNEVENEVQFNDELFLKQICKYPTIYESQIKGFVNRHQRFKAWENIASSMGATVDFCTKRWKSLREKYHREKKKNINLLRSGADTASIPTWQYMSFFEFMYNKTKPRQTSPSSILAENGIIPGVSTSENLGLSQKEMLEEEQQNQIPQVWIEHTPKNTSGIKRRCEKENPVVGPLDKAGNAQQTNTTATSDLDKISAFARYLALEIRDLPSSEQNEFMDDTLMRLLQIKRRNLEKN